VADEDELVRRDFEARGCNQLSASRQLHVLELTVANVRTYLGSVTACMLSEQNRLRMTAYWRLLVCLNGTSWRLSYSY
jgi:hypothetical protein